MLAASETQAADEHIASVTPTEVDRYSRYMDDVVKPKTTEDVFRRVLFAFSSVHTSWLSNVRMYNELKDLQWLGNEQALKDAIIRSGAGLHNNRTRFIMEFSQFFWDHPLWFTKSRHETWGAYRDRLETKIKGLGFAKSSFMTELLYPVECAVLCTDTHMIQLYGRVQGKTPVKIQREIEQHWVDTCTTRRVPAAVARWVYWDRKQGGENGARPDSRYWTYVFEKENFNVRLSKLSSLSAAAREPVII